MLAPKLVAKDYASALLRLRPFGEVWPRDGDSVQEQAITGLAPTYERNHTRALELLADAFPPYTNELLPEWEASLGLPDPCVGPVADFNARRAQVVARFVAEGGQSIHYYVGFALNLGYVITITEFRPFTVGQPVNNPLYGQIWAHAWRVNGALNSIRVARANEARAGDRLRTWGNAVLECEMTSIAPRHTIMQFAYT